MAKPKGEGIKKHGDELEHLIERTETGKRDEQADDATEIQSEDEEGSDS